MRFSVLSVVVGALCGCGAVPDDAPWCTVQTCRGGCCDAQGKCGVCHDTPNGCRTTCGGACGAVDDGCGGTIACGSCGGDGGCFPKTCASAGKTCGAIDDGCGGTVQCGGCLGTQTCGGGGTPNVCGSGACVPTTCAAQARTCGALSDGCSATLSCGTCAGFLTCGGAGTPGVCGAVCAVSCPTGFSCDAMGVCRGGSLTGLVFDEPAFAVAGRVTLNGATPTRVGTCPSAAAELVTVEFFDPASSYRGRAQIPCGTTDFSFSTRLPRGTFEVRVVPNTSGVGATARLVPGSVPVRLALAVNGPLANLVLDEAAVAVAGKLTVNGALPTRNALCQAHPADAIAHLTFSDRQSGVFAGVDLPCSTPDFGFSTLLPVGTWDVRVAPGLDPSLAGLNLAPVSWPVRTGLAITQAVTNLVLDEAVVPVSGKVLVGGSSPAGPKACAAPNARLVGLRFSDGAGSAGELSIFCNTTDYAFATFLPKGSWQVRVRGTYEARGLNLLPGDFLAASALVVNGPLNNVVLNEVGFAVSGKVTVNGAMPTRNGYCALAGNADEELLWLDFTDAAKGYSDSVTIPCSTTDFGFARVLPAGTYEVRIHRANAAVRAGLATLPANYRVSPGLVVSGPMPNLVFNQPAFAFAGRVTVNGAKPTHSAACATAPNEAAAAVELTDAAARTSVVIPILCSAGDFAFSGLVPPGTYAVKVTVDRYSAYAAPGLLPLDWLALPSLAVGGPVANLTLNEVARAIAGRVTVNAGLPPRTGTCPAGSQLAFVGFSELTTFAYTAVSIPCSTTDFAVSTQLPPGVYAVDVAPGAFAAQAGLGLLPATYRAIGRLAVP